MAAVELPAMARATTVEVWKTTGTRQEGAVSVLLRAVDGCAAALPLAKRCAHCPWTLYHIGVEPLETA